MVLEKFYSSGARKKIHVLLAEEDLPKQKMSLKQCMSSIMRKPTVCIGENNEADQIGSNCEADQRQCFRHRDSTVPLLF